MLFDDTMKKLLAHCRTIAIVGAKDVSGQPVDMVGRYLIAAGYDVVPVHAVRKEVWGLPTYRKLADIPRPVDLVNLFRASHACPEHARETLALPSRVKGFWMQSGIRSREAGSMLAAAGICVVEDACIMVEHKRLGVADA